MITFGKKCTLLFSSYIRVTNEPRAIGGRRHRGHAQSHVASHINSLSLSLSSLNMRSGIFDEFVDEHGPGAFLVVVGHVLVDHVAEIEEQIPRVARDGSLIVFFQELAPQIEKLETTGQNYVPIGDGHVQVEPFLTRVLSVVESELIKVFKLGRIFDFVFHCRALQFEPVDGIASDFRHAVDEFLLRKLALSRRLEFPGDDEHDLALRVQTQILEKPHHSFRRHFIIFLGIFVFVEKCLDFLPVDGRFRVSAVAIGVLKEIVCGDIKLPVMLG